MYHSTRTGKILYLCKLEVFLRQIIVVVPNGKRQGPTLSPAQEEEGSQDTWVHLAGLCWRLVFPQSSTLAFIGLQ
jgi:hypothetical protein